METKITDFEKALYIADKLGKYRGIRRFEPEDILAKCQNPLELDFYYYGLRDIIDSYTKYFVGR